MSNPFKEESKDQKIERVRNDIKGYREKLEKIDSLLSGPLYDSQIKELQERRKIWSGALDRARGFLHKLIGEQP